jgi:ATP-dependent helicase/nuclease subunit A
MTPEHDMEWPERDAALRGQAAAAEPDACAWVEANAGSGKTKVLIDRVARLLLKGAAPDSITCVTYTKAAASEMQSRLFGVLGEWCVMAPEKLKGELAKLEKRDTFSDEELGRARELFAKALETPGGLRIETIHAFCGRVLRRFPIEAGVAPGFQELDDEATEGLWDDAIRALGAKVAHGSKETVAAARAVAEAGGGGLGLVRELDARRAQVEAFVRRAGGIEQADELLRVQLQAPRETVEQILEEAMGAHLPREALKQLAAALPVAKASDAELARVISVALSDAPAEARHDAYAGVVFTAAGEVRKSNCYTADAVKVAPSVVGLFQMKDIPQGSEIERLLKVEDTLRARVIYEKSAALLRIADVVFRDFERRKDARAGLDFDDLINTVNRLLARDHAAEWVLWKLDGGIAHVLLDEAQDTSPAQWRILRALTDDIFSGESAERKHQRTMFVVGDEKQSIYSFQGADPEEFLSQGRDVRGQAEVVNVRFNTPHLAMSFRSVREVLAYVDEVFDPEVYKPEAPFSLQTQGEQDYARHTAFRKSETGCVELWPLEPPAGSDDPDPWDAPIDQQTQTSPVVKLAKQVAQFVRREIDVGSAVWDGRQSRPAGPGDFLILVKRRTGGFFDAVLQQLKLQRLPVAGADRIQLLDSLPVQDLLNLVRFALCPEDDLVLAEILKGPFGGLNDDDLLELAYERPASLWREVQGSKSARVAKPRTFLADLLIRTGEAPFEFLTRALERAIGHDRPGWELIFSRFGDPAKEPVTALLDRAAAFDAGQPASLELFLAAVEHHGGEVKRELSGPQGEVRVMTVHGAKGLQAPIVILPDTTSAPKYDRSGLFVISDWDDARDQPGKSDGAPVWVGPKIGDTSRTRELRAESDARALREHRRLLYVALTRAQDRLLVCGAWNGQAKKTGCAEDSWYSLCLEGMQRLVSKGEARETEQDGRKLLRFGDPPDLLLPAITSTTPPPEPDWLRKPARPEREPQRILSPSSLGGGEPPPIPPFGQDRERRLRRGRLIHKLLESLPDIPPKSRRKAARDFLKRQTDLSPAQREEMLEAAFGVIENAEFAAVFAPGGRAEAPVIGRIGGDIVNGRVDRLVVTEDEVLIVDFKTDRPAPATVAGVGRSYIAQMDAYAEALQQAWPGRRVRRLLVWTDGPRLMEV